MLLDVSYLSNLQAGLLLELRTGKQFSFCLDNRTCTVHMSSSAQATIISQTWWLKQQNFIAHDPGAWKSEIMVPAWSGSDDTYIPGLHVPPSHCVLTWQREGELSGIFSYKDTSPFRSGPYPHDLI